MFIAPVAQRTRASRYERRAKVSFPPGAQLPDVLKSIYLQQRFLEFVIANQGRSPAELHAAFGRFVRDHDPASETGPTQQPGVIRTDPVPTAAPPIARTAPSITEGAVA